MKFEVLKRGHLKRNIVIGVLVIATISAIVLQFTRAKYKTAESLPLYNATVNYTPYDFKMIAMYQENDTGEYESIDTVPSGGYKLNEDDSYCEVNSTKDENITIDHKDGSITFGNVTKKGTKCYIYFDFIASYLILANNTINEEHPDFSKTAQANCTGISNCETTNGLFLETTTKGTTYYFRGAVNNNWIYFGGFYWRIIRINEDGSIRILYNGTNTSQTGNQNRVGSSYFGDLSTGVSFVYINEDNSETDSIIKGVLDEWYSNNLDKYTEYIDGNAGFCGDRTLYSGISSSLTYYSSYGRLALSNKNPNLECQNESDLYTLNNSNHGNKKLQYPIGFITADEIAYAGGVYNYENTSYYLYSGNSYWSLSPSYYESGWPYVFEVDSSGKISDGYVWGSGGIRPVINLRADITISSGTGTQTDPYVIET